MRELFQSRTQHAADSRPHFPPEVMQLMDAAVQAASDSIDVAESECTSWYTTLLVIEHAPELLRLVEELVAMPEFIQLDNHVCQQRVRRTFNAELRA